MMEVSNNTHMVLYASGIIPNEWNGFSLFITDKDYI